MAPFETICIVGAKGMLGQELVQTARRLAPNAVVHGIDMDEIDIADATSTAEILAEIKPDLVINAAAYTDVDGCETNQDLAAKVNGDGPANLATSCQAIGAKLVHVSTDYVFDGTKTTPYVPEDPMNPQGVYGRTKRDGEEQVRAILPNHMIVRTSWLYAAHSKNFVRTILKAAQEREELTVVDDQVGCPTYAPDLAAMLVKLGRSDRTGTYHFCNAGHCSWNEFAREIVTLADLKTRVLPMSTAQLNRPAPRPAWSVLDTSRITRDMQITPRPWQDALAECMAKLK